MSTPLPALIFDLDGTLTDSKPGILSCLQKTIEAHGIEYADPLDRFIGPPVEAWVCELLPDGTEAQQAALVHDYRDCYDREGWSNNSVFPGVREMITQLHHAGYPLYVCTSKHKRFAVRILDLFELSGMFTSIYGDQAEFASHRKEDLLEMLVSECGLVRESTWMIGDRSFDIEAARANQIRSLAAGWGYGSADEFATADAVAASPAEVLALVSPAQVAR
jgi:phosphoglycolate phosphatase